MEAEAVSGSVNRCDSHQMEGGKNSLLNARPTSLKTVEHAADPCGVGDQGAYMCFHWDVHVLFRVNSWLWLREYAGCFPCPWSGSSMGLRPPGMIPGMFTLTSQSSVSAAPNNGTHPLAGNSHVASITGPLHRDQPFMLIMILWMRDVKWRPWLGSFSRELIVIPLPYERVHTWSLWDDFIVWNILCLLTDCSWLIQSHRPCIYNELNLS